MIKLHKILIFAIITCWPISSAMATPALAELVLQIASEITGSQDGEDSNTCGSMSSDTAVAQQDDDYPNCRIGEDPDPGASPL